MTVDLLPIIYDIASRADEFLSGASNRAQGRAGIEELVTMDYSALDAADRKIVVAGVMQVLEAEDFFGTEFVGDPFSEPDDPDDE